MKSEFELKSLDLALQRLLEDNVLKNKEQKEKLFEVYKKDPRKYSLIHEEIRKLRFDKELLEKMLKKDELIAGKNSNSIDTNKKAEYALSLENITDFEKDGKSYIKIHYPYPYDNVRIIENRTDPHQTGKERFEALSGTQKVISTDGVTNATSIFEQSLVRDCHEINVRDIKEVSTATEYSKLSFEQKEKVYGTIKSIIYNLPVSDEEKRVLSSKSVDAMLEALNKKVYISPEDNIVVICEQNEPEKDEVKTLSVTERVNKNGSISKNYTLKPVNENGYKYEESNDEIEYENIEFEKQNEEDIEKEMGVSLKPKAPWQKRRKKEAAFISILWFVIFLGVIAAIIFVSLINLIINK